MAEFDILIREAGGDWVHPTHRSYGTEKEMQVLLASNPAWVPGVELGAIAAQELWTVAGPADICVLTDDGSITVVECKLHSNSENRRMVIGQVLDYASAISMAGPEAFRANWMTATQQDPRELLGDVTWEQVIKNLESGYINLCLAVDAIDEDIRRLVEYLNKISIPAIAVTALELQYAKHNQFEVLVPHVFGQELAAAKSTKSTKHSWTQEDVLDHLRTHESGKVVEFVEELIKACVELGCAISGGSAALPSLAIWFNSSAGPVYPYSIYCYPAGNSGVLEFGFQWITRASESARLAFAKQITEMLDIGITLSELKALNFRKRPNVSFEKISAIPDLAASLATAQKVLQDL